MSGRDGDLGLTGETVGDRRRGSEGSDRWRRAEVRRYGC